MSAKLVQQIVALCSLKNETPRIPGAARELLAEAVVTLNDHAERIASLEVVKSSAVELEAALRTDGADWKGPINKLRLALGMEAQ